jgi:hypothetical protein
MVPAFVFPSARISGVRVPGVRTQCVTTSKDMERNDNDQDE